jgi:hypothetical protein
MIKELITDLVNDKIDLTTALTKAKIIALHIKDESFTNWLIKELKGYAIEDKMPTYRRLSCITKVIVSDRWGNQKELPIGESSNPEFDEMLTHHSIHQSISAIEENYKLIKDQAIVHNELYPQQLNALSIIFKDFLQPKGLKIVRGHQETHSVMVKEVISQTKQSLLDTLLELNTTFPNFENNFEESKENKDKVSAIITNNIYGNSSPVNIGVGETVTQSQNIQISSEIDEELVKFLVSYGADDSDINELKEIAAEKNNAQKKEGVGKKIINWIGKLGTKAIEKGIELNVPLLMEKINHLM